jgi:uncharacterized repeat protein (TIGR03803 family)
MRGKSLPIGLRAAVLIFTVIVFGTSSWAASETVLYSFHPEFPDGINPEAGLIFDGAGNLYGTTIGGGTYGGGTVFELTPQAGGGWTKQVLHDFGNGTDGAGPYGSLIFDGSGNLYGTTGGGGTYNGGTVFQLTPQAGGGWTEKVLYSFGNSTDGAGPNGSLIFDGSGNLYGTTYRGGTSNHGTVFELTPQAGGGWTEKVLHSFKHNGTDGYNPYAGLILDSAGNLYGTTYGGGTYKGGTVFELTPQAGGGWTENVLYSFDRAHPYAGLIFDADGNLYGTTKKGGRHKGGTVFKLTPQAGGGDWKEKVLYTFTGYSGGAIPYAGLIFDRAGNLYGTTQRGGTYDNGTAFELSPLAGGGWTENVLYSFGNGVDGFQPGAGLIFDAVGNLYGTTYLGGTYNNGTVFELTPQGGGGWTENVLYSFNNNGTDAGFPHGGVIFDAAGSLYGTTRAGGAHNAGAVFELTPQAGGGWTEKVLYSFKNNGTDAFNPLAGLIFDGAGNLYGTTSRGGIHDYGTVFELTPTAGEGWTEKVLYSFGNGTDGGYPEAGLLFDGAGNLYGTTVSGGTYTYGTVFELIPQAGGGWTENVLHSFGNGTDGANPTGLIADGAGNLYGTTVGGGYGSGTVFELTPQAGGGWTEKVLYSFSNGSDGGYPYAGLIFDGAGNLYGTTSEGGFYTSGTVFELTPQAGGGWTEQVLHSFNYRNGDGVNPYAGLIFDGAGNLYGTTSGGGTYGGGTVFELTPQAGGGWTENVLNSFGNGTNGASPTGSLVADGAGNLYGATSGGGTYGGGTVFEIIP